jgi:hypothetical protein
VTRRSLFLLMLLLVFAERTTAQTCNAWFTLRVSAGALPDGLSLDPETGEITGTPSALGSFQFTIEATTPCAVSAREYTIVVPPATPASFTATATSQTSVALSWQGVAGSPSYQIERYQVTGGVPVILGPVVATSFVDNGVIANTTYLYRVRAVANGAASSFTAINPATTVTFTDTPLNPGTTVKAIHVTQLRTAVNAMRTAAGLGPGTYPALAIGSTIARLDVTSLRDALNEARTALALGPQPYTDSLAIATTVKAMHIEELRTGVR